MNGMAAVLGTSIIAVAPQLDTVRIAIPGGWLTLRSSESVLINGRETRAEMVWALQMGGIKLDYKPGSPPSFRVIQFPEVERQNFFYPYPLIPRH